MKNAFYAVFSAFLAVFLVGCGSEKINTKDPSVVALTFAQNLADGNLTKMIDLYAANDEETAKIKILNKDELEKIQVVFKDEISKEFARRDGFRDLQIVQKDVVGNEATINIRFAFNNGSGVEKEFALRFANDEWRIHDNTDTFSLFMRRRTLLNKFGF